MQEEYRDHDQVDDDDVEVSLKLNRMTHMPRLGTEERFRLEEQERQEHRRMLQDKRRQQDSKYTFKPHILDSAQGAERRPTLVERTAADHERLAQRAQQKELHEEAYMSKNCPFQPSILPESDAKATEMFRQGKAENSSARVEERLLDYGQIRKHNKEELRKARERDERHHLQASFVPRTNQRSASAGGGDSSTTFIERLAKNKEASEVRRQKLHELEDTVYTFKPQINALSKEIYKSREGLHNNGSWTEEGAPSARAYSEGQGHMSRAEAVSERLYLEGKDQRAQRRAMKEKMEQEEMNEVSPRPHTNPNSSAIVAHDQAYRNMSFVERQEYFHENRVAAMDELERKVDAERMRQVGIDPHSPEYKRVGYDFIQDQVDRLYEYTRGVSHDAKTEMKVRLQEEQCPFKPQLSHGSEALVRQKHYGETMPAYERLHRQASQSRGRSASVDSRSGRPQKRGGNADVNTSVVSATPEDARDFYMKQIQRQEERDVKVEKNRVEQNMRKELSCSFRPVINPEPLRPQSARRTRSVDTTRTRNVRAGEAEFQERQQKARQLKEENKQRQENLGRGKTCNGPNYTVMVPFNLSSATNLNTSAAAQRKHRAAAGGGNAPSSAYSSAASTKSLLLKAVTRQKHGDPNAVRAAPLAQLPNNVADTVSRIFGGSASISAGGEY